MTLLWILWIIAFFLLEVPAALNKTPGDTLSEHVWKWFAVRDRSGKYRWRRILLLIILAWLVVHLLTGGSFV